MRRPVLARIDLAALRHNFSRVRESAPGRRVLAVIKANAYGHGAVRVARALDEADGFAVARLDEGLTLREAGVEARVLVLGGVSEPGDVELAASHGLDLAVHHAAQIDALEAAKPSTAVGIWLKVNSGMHRLGFEPRAVAGIWRRLHDCAAVGRPVRVMTHLANADDPADPTTTRQCEVFRACTAELETEASIANSAGVLAWPDSHADWVRPGIMLYGISPFPERIAGDDRLRPVMTFQSRLVAINRVPQGEVVGYGGTWTAPQHMPVGVVAVGYGDGYPRHAPSGTPVLVKGHRAPLVGRVSMDLVTVDLRDVPDPAPGDPVVLWGRGLPVEEVAVHVGTIGYELVTRVSTWVDCVEED